MSELLKRMRHRRYQLKADADVQLHIETQTGARFKLKVLNVSLSGLGGDLDREVCDEDGIAVGSILPALKLTVQTTEFALGRAVVRVLNSSPSGTQLGISLIDSRTPLDTSLSGFLSETFEETSSAFEFELSPDKFSMASFAESQSRSTDIFSKANQFALFKKEWEKSAKFSYENTRLASFGHRIRLSKKRRGGREDYIVMGSNDYLGLAGHPDVLDAAKRAIDDYGFGSTGSPVTTGITDLHVELCEVLSKMFKKEDTLLFNSGYAANVGTITGLVYAQDLVVADMLSHASIQDAIQMCKGTGRFFKHNNPDHLDKVLGEHRDAHAGCLVVTEGVFSMDGDVPPLDQIISVSRKHRARIMLDQAHCFGVIGQHGLGAVEKYNAFQSVDIIMGTFSKICGGIGGFISAEKETIDWLRFWARSHMFSVSIPPSTAAAALKALQIFKNDRSLLSQLKSNIAHFKKGLSELGYNLAPDHESAVIPVVVGDEKVLEKMNSVLMDHGVFVVPIVYPAVSRTQCRFRFTMMATHTVSDLDYVLNVLELAMERAGFRFGDRSPVKMPA
jgi:8-amino-7-oxononanoate synthase